MSDRAHKGEPDRAASLDAYQAKRRFTSRSNPGGTSEPHGGKRPGTKAGTSGTTGLRYVVQAHHARNLHYDFRLELDGTLKSWAVPKGPSTNPKDKRLAVEVEDHPVEYGRFEGRIPPGHYGAGEVRIWDSGTWEPEGGIEGARNGYVAGKLHFRLHDGRLRGNWALIRTRPGGKQPQWLLRKLADNHAGTHAGTHVGGPAENQADPLAGGWREVWAKLKSHAKRCTCPETIEPQLATLAQDAPAGDDWHYEVKLDGYRTLIRLDTDPTHIRIRTRQGHDWTRKLQIQADAVSAWWASLLPMNRSGKTAPGAAWFDAEAVALDPNGLPSFQSLQNAFDSDRAEQVILYFFDILYFDGYDLRDLPLLARRTLLKALLAGPEDQSRDALQPASPPTSRSASRGAPRSTSQPLEQALSPLIRFSPEVAAPVADLLAHACRLGLEGLIGKRGDSPYRSGRSQAWIKLKCRRRQEFVIGGFTEPAGSRQGLGALLLGVYDKQGAGQRLLYAGRVGTGFDAGMLRTLRATLNRHETPHRPFDEPPAGQAGGKVHWVEPTLVAECVFAEWTSGHLVRQAAFVQLREDKPADSIVRETPQPVSNSASRAVRDPKSASESQKHAAAATFSGVRISHPDRVLDRVSGIRKRDLAAYYEWVAPWLLPHLRHRPVSLVRVPGDIDGEQFFQKHAARLSIPNVTQHPKLDPGHPPLITIDSLDALMGAAQMGAIELHTWNSRTDRIEQPDRIVFDLDPDTALPWRKIVEAAQLLRAFLAELGLTSFCKTSGGKGVHVVVPLTRHGDWASVKTFAHDVATHLAMTLPTHFSDTMGKNNRKNKIFVDYLRNNRGASTVSAYSARARPGLGVSVPVSWDELAETTAGDQWTLANIRSRMADYSNDPWAAWSGYADTRQRLTAAMQVRLKRASLHRK